MSNPIIRVHNSTTDEVIDREMTNEEYADYQTQQTKDKMLADAALKAADDKAALLLKLGISADEAKLLLG